MTRREDFLVEIHTEELPPKSLMKLAESFWLQIKERLQKSGLSFDDMIYFATPRRLSVLVKQLSYEQPEQIIEKKGPALQAAFTADGKPTPACIGFAKSCSTTPDALITLKSEQGEWVGFKQTVSGKTVKELLPTIIEESASALPIPKRMRWSDKETQFVRPVHSLILLYGEEIIPATLFGCESGRDTRGHHFMAPDWITIPHADSYASLLETEGYVIANFAKRRETIRQQIIDCLQQQLAGSAIALQDEALLNEVTGLVEWPVALCGSFDANFLTLPKEVLISSMQDHQRYFPVVDAQGKLLPHFITIANIKTHNTSRILQGNERVLRARLSDAAFFYTADQKEKLEKRVDKLKGIVFQAKLGSLYDRAERLSKLSGFVANRMKLDPEQVLLAGVAGVLAKADLTTNMVGEFPELQGTMGYYYARLEGEREEIALALKEHYLPRFANDVLPTHPVSVAVALADRADMLAGAFAINQQPTGDKDPFGLRRAALGILRIILEHRLSIDLKEVLGFALSNYDDKVENEQALVQLLAFFQERLRAWYQEQGVSADIFASVAALNISNPLDVDARIKAVQAFKQLNAAEALSAANKRVSNILAKSEQALSAESVDATFFDSPAELELAKQLEAKSTLVASLYQAKEYDQVLLQLAELRQPVDNFFDHVMVMTDNKVQRENRLLLLKKLRALFLQVADIALLQ